MKRLVVALQAAICVGASTAEDLPNIPWIVFEEIGACRDSYASTPHLDRFARQSVLLTRAFSNGGACEPARSTLITGMCPPAIGTHHMCSEGVPPPAVRGFTEILRASGCFASNHAKTDYNWKQAEST